MGNQSNRVRAILVPTAIVALGYAVIFLGLWLFAVGPIQN
jgi:hypothetical protein